MDEVIRIGLDTSKSVFQVHGVNAQEHPVLRRRLTRAALPEFFSRLAPCVVALEACGASHHWARVLTGFGHDVRLIAPQLAKPYVMRGKNDAADAAALCEAASRPQMRFVPVKTPEQQAALMLAGVRDGLVRRRTQLANTIRGHAAEYGIVAALGLDKIAPLLERIRSEAGVPALARELFALLAEEYAQVEVRVRAAEARLRAWHRANPGSRRLAAIPGLGPVGATLLVMKTPEPRAFGSGRDFSAWLGLTPKDHSTAGKQRLGGITRAGDETLRRLLVAGAMAVILHLRRKLQRGVAPSDKTSVWLAGLLARKPVKLVAVALANRTARTAWRMMASGEAYDSARAAITPLGLRTRGAAPT